MKKKMLALLLSAAMAFSLTACGPGETNSPRAGGGGAAAGGGGWGGGPGGCGVRLFGDSRDGCGSIWSALADMDERNLDGVFSIKMTRQGSYGNIV